MKRRARYEILTNLSVMVANARTIGQKMKALYLLRRFFVTQHPAAIVSSIDLALHDLEEQLTPFERTILARDGYVFADELENVPEMMRNRERDQPTDD